MNKGILRGKEDSKENSVLLRKKVDSEQAIKKKEVFF